ncbi:MAG: ABC transporter ATP-binding protein/permease, partial [Pseudomonadota bacterium]
MDGGSQDPTTQKVVSADEGSTLSTLANLWPYIWPSDRPDLKRRVLLSIAALIVAKFVTVLSPYFFAWATDVLAGETAGLPAFLIAPVMLVLAYNAARFLAVAFNQIRDALFASVGQYAVRQLAMLTFQHLHRLSLRFHLARRTGGLSRVIERGVKGIEAIVRFTILSGIPTVFEFAIMAAVIWYQFGFFYVVVVAAMIFAYVWFTIKCSNWRIALRREMNDNDTDANSKAIDSLLNFETVKYFGNEKMEAERFDVSMAKYETAATKTWTSLAWLNLGQAVILGIGMATCMALSARAVMSGEQNIGDFVLINALLMQISIPLNFIGFLYREIRQGLADIESMFDLLLVPAEIQDKDGAEPLNTSGGRIAFKDVKFHYDPDRPILKGVDFEVPAGKTIAIVGPSGA